MTEDDTFKRLTRCPFYQIRDQWKEARYRGGLTEEECKELGWTRKEYIETNYRKWRDNEL